jgi:hypothetical protein
MIFPNTNTNKEIENYLSKIYSQFSEEEKIHFNELNARYSLAYKLTHQAVCKGCMYPQNNTFERILSIIITVEEGRVPLGQEVGDFAQGLINLSPPDIQELYIEFVKQERLDTKLRKTFKDFEKILNEKFPY